jgi:hypothetical protein
MSEISKENNEEKKPKRNTTKKKKDNRKKSKEEIAVERIKKKRRLLLKAMHDVLNKIKKRRKIFVFRNIDTDSNIVKIHILAEGLDMPAYTSPPIDFSKGKNGDILFDLIFSFCQLSPIVTATLSDFHLDNNNEYLEIINDYGDSFIFCTYYSDDYIDEKLIATEYPEEDDEETDKKIKNQYQYSIKKMVEVIMQIRNDKSNLSKLRKSKTGEITITPVKVKRKSS